MNILLTKDNYEFLIYFFTINGFEFILEYQNIKNILIDLKEYFLKDERNVICFLEIDVSNNTLVIYSKIFNGETVLDMANFLRKG
jgi:hypothetical protein